MRSNHDSLHHEDKEFLNQFDHRNVDSRHRELTDNVPSFEGFDEGKWVTSYTDEGNFISVDVMNIYYIRKDFGHANANTIGSPKSRIDGKNQFGDIEIWCIYDF